jgi:hypothetical protein
VPVAVEVTVTPPVEPDKEMPVPAVSEVTPVFVSVGVLPPVDEIPVLTFTAVTPEVVCVVASLNVSVVLLAVIAIIDS